MFPVPVRVYSRFGLVRHTVGLAGKKRTCYVTDNNTQLNKYEEALFLSSVSDLSNKYRLKK